MTYLDFLNARVSIRDFDSNDVIEQSKIEEILRHAANAPSSNNFQPWKVYAVANKNKQEKIMSFSGQQKQIKDASFILIVLGDASLYNVDKIMDFNIEKGILNIEDKQNREERVKKYLNLHPEDIGIEGLKFDLGLFSMNLMHVVRAFGYDSVPMRGVDFERVKDYLAIPNEYEAMLLLPVGKAITPGYPHIRYELENFATIIR